MLKFVLMFQVCLFSAIPEISWDLRLFDFAWSSEEASRPRFMGTADLLLPMLFDAFFAFACDKVQNLELSPMSFCHL